MDFKIIFLNKNINYYVKIIGIRLVVRMIKEKWTLDYIKNNPISYDDVMEMKNKGIVFKRESIER